MKQLERLLFLQGQRCFFCRETIPSGEASVEHLVATSNGGTNDDDNCVVCCKAVNTALGHLPVKAKLQAVLNHCGAFACPKSVERVATPTREPIDERIALVVADLQKRGTARPRRIATLKNTINAAFQMSLSDGELDVVVATLQSRGYVVTEGTTVSYALPAHV